MDHDCAHTDGAHHDGAADDDAKRKWSDWWWGNAEGATEPERSWKNRDWEVGHDAEQGSQSSWDNRDSAAGHENYVRGAMIDEWTTRVCFVPSNADDPYDWVWPEPDMDDFRTPRVELAVAQCNPRRAHLWPKDTILWPLDAYTELHRNKDQWWLTDAEISKEVNDMVFEPTAIKECLDLFRKGKKKNSKAS